MAKATKLPSGKWRCKAYYTDEYGNYKSKSFTAEKKKDAEGAAALFLMERRHASRPENKTMGELIDRYIDSQSNLLSPSTIVGYRKIRRTAFQDIVDVRIGFLTKEKYQKAVNEYSKGRAPKTVLSAHSLFHKVMKENDIIIGDNIRLPQKQKKEIQIPTTEEVVAFLKQIKGTRLYTMVLFAVYLGLRRSEIAAIKWKDINFEEGTVLIDKARVKDEYGMYVEKTTKTYSSTRILKMPQALTQELPEAGDPDSYIIDDSIDALDSLYKRMTLKTDFPYNFHALRHYNASIMLQMGIPTKYAQERMGHSTPNMLTNVYQHTFQSQQKEYDTILNQSMFYGIIVSMYNNDTEHNPAHIHVKYAEYNAKYDLEGNRLKGELPRNKEKLLLAWMEIHKEELKANWELAMSRETLYKIEPLK